MIIGAMSNITNLKLDDMLLVVIIILLIFMLIHKHWSDRLGKANQPEEIGISNLVERVRTELRQAEEKRLNDNDPSLFKLENVDLEINFVIKHSGTANAGITLEPVTVGGQTEVSAEKVQKVTLHLKTNPAERYQESSATGKFDQNEKFETVEPKPSDSVKGEKQ